MLIYYLNSAMLFSAKDGWSLWGPWSSCNSHTGEKRRTRHCKEAESCSGSSSESVSCPGELLSNINLIFKNIFLVNGGWSSWGSWSTCNTQTRTKKRTRQCNKPKPLNGGATCFGSFFEKDFCSGAFIIFSFYP